MARLNLLNSILLKEKLNFNLKRFLTIDDPNKNHNDCDYEEDMNEPTDSKRSNKTEKPKNQQNRNDCGNHVCIN